MADIVEPLRAARILANPKRFVLLRDFSCGRRGQPWEKVINQWAREVYLGTVTKPQTVVVLEDADGKLIGACSFRSEPVYREPYYIRASKLIGSTHRLDMLALDRRYHGKRLEDGSRPSDALLSGAIEHIKDACGGSMPYVWALISPTNDRSRALFRRHGFRELPYPGVGEVVYVRPPHRRLPVFLLDEKPSLMARLKGRRRSLPQTT